MCLGFEACRYNGEMVDTDWLKELLFKADARAHVVFDRSVGWGENMRVVAWVALLSGKEKLRRWFFFDAVYKDEAYFACIW